MKVVVIGTVAPAAPVIEVVDLVPLGLVTVDTEVVAPTDGEVEVTAMLILFTTDQHQFVGFQLINLVTFQTACRGIRKQGVANSAVKADAAYSFATFDYLYTCRPRRRVARCKAAQAVQA